MIKNAPTLATEPASAAGASDVRSRYHAVRSLTEKLCATLVTEDYLIQSMPDASPAKWHLAHTTWFFETFVIRQAWPDVPAVHPQYSYLFNSYYNAVGPRHCRPMRGLISRPTVEQVYSYRRVIDQRMDELLGTPGANVAGLIELGLHHEQQHQELLLTDLKHAFSINPLYPTFREAGGMPTTEVRPLGFVPFEGGLVEIGHAGGGFAYDNESPRHRTYLQPFALGDRLVTAGEYAAFVDDGGYRRPELWLSDGWAAVNREQWSAPLYWQPRGAGWAIFTLTGLRELTASEPVCHVSHYEADAYARWAGARLPREQELEHAAGTIAIRGNFVDAETFHPQPADPGDPGLQQVFGDLWEWTQSPYVGYPGYHPAAGAIGEYNGKFMCNQFVLRGGSCATSHSHMRATYRNFFHPDARWQFTGIRLARDEA